MNNLTRLYNNLVQEFGDPEQYWPQWCAKKKTILDREKIIIGMILVQRTTWHNAEMALNNLKKQKLLSVDKIASLTSLEKLTQLIRSAGFYQSKPKRLFDICKFVIDHGGITKLMKMDTIDLRHELLLTKGIGQETADTILLYALDKSVFIIDEYTRRWVKMNRSTNNTDYHQLQQYFQKHLKPNINLYQQLHALIIISQRGKEKSMMKDV